MAPTYENIKRQLERYWINYLRENSKTFLSSNVAGASPPSIFVGHYGYPKVNVGPMVPQLHGNTKILDSPEMWIGKTTQDILNYRLSLIRGVNSFKINDIDKKFITSLQELIMSTKPAESEMNFNSKPRLFSSGSYHYNDDFSQSSLNIESPPFGPTGEIKTFKISSIKTDKKIDYFYSDNDIKASNAVIELYNSGIEVSQINKILSLGMLGIKKRRRLVPTRWSISATDDVISNYLVRKLEANRNIDSFMVFKYSHLSNYYSIILIPDEVWNFEMIEAWFDKTNKRFVLESDFEDATGLDHYPKIAGAYFAAKLGITEYLFRKKRKASALILREIRPEYIIPLGVWQIREAIREALKQEAIIESFDDFRSALKYSCQNLQVSILKWIGKSSLYRNFGKQLRISNFFK